jgi:hypothetical protein
VTDIAAMPASDPVADPVDELNDVAAMTQDSLDAGYTGLRIVADGTLRVLNRRRRDRIVRYEHLIDRFCLDHALTRLCAFDATASMNSSSAASTRTGWYGGRSRALGACGRIPAAAPRQPRRRSRTRSDRDTRSGSRTPTAVSPPVTAAERAAAVSGGGGEPAR